MRIDLEFVELHSSLFIDGTNFGLKLYDDRRNKAPIKLWYDTDLRHTVVIFKDKVSLIESTASMTLKDPNQIGIKVMTPVTVAQAKTILTQAETIRAQVAGPGVGLKHSAQVSDPTREAPKTILRKAKFQGQESQGE